MADEPIIEPSSEPSGAEQRIRQLSEKVRTTSEERDEKARLIDERDKTIAELERDNAFNSGFVDVLATHAAAREFKNDIHAKVMSGLSVEDATFAVLGKAGKLGAPAPAPVASPAGGSAATGIVATEEKTLATMTQAERRQALVDNEGDLARILTPQIG